MSRHVFAGPAFRAAPAAAAAAAALLAGCAGPLFQIGQSAAPTPGGGSSHGASAYAPRSGDGHGAGSAHAPAGTHGAGGHGTVSRQAVAHVRLPDAGHHGAPDHGHRAGGHAGVPDSVLAAARHHLATSTHGQGFGPQSPRDIDSRSGGNHRHFNLAPKYFQMNLCNIHFHRNAEHRGGEFRTYAGNGDGHGYGSGYVYSGPLSPRELMPMDAPVCPGKHGGLVPGDTIEVHYVHSTAQVEPGPTLGACMNAASKNPQLRVEAQVYVLVNDPGALDFERLTRLGRVSGLHQAIGMPTHTGRPVEYAGSTTGPGFNEKGSPFEVTWGVRPRVAKVDIHTVGRWCSGNVFDEDHAHGVRNLVVNRDLLSAIGH